MPPAGEWNRSSIHPNYKPWRELDGIPVGSTPFDPFLNCADDTPFGIIRAIVLPYIDHGVVEHTIYIRCRSQLQRQVKSSRRNRNLLSLAKLLDG